MWRLSRAPVSLRRIPASPEAREKALSTLERALIDAPILDLILGFTRIPRCFTIQSCYGHFVHPGQPDPSSVDPLPPAGAGRVRYRIAYLAVCIENSAEGERLREGLRAVMRIGGEGGR